MGYTFHPGGTLDEKNIAFVRDLIDDLISTDQRLDQDNIEGVDYFLSDERILSRIETAGAELGSDAALIEIRLMAAASCLNTLAINQGYVLKKQKTMEEETDGPAVADSIRKDAAQLAARARSARDTRLAAGARVAEPLSGGGYIDLRY